MWTAALDRMTRVVRDTFPTLVVYLPRSGGSHSITGIFDLASKVIEQDKSTGLNIDSTAPTLTVRLADLTSAPRPQDTLTIGASTYEVYRVEPDGSGMAALRLTEVA